MLELLLRLIIVMIVGFLVGVLLGIIFLKCEIAFCRIKRCRSNKAHLFNFLKKQFLNPSKNSSRWQHFIHQKFHSGEPFSGNYYAKSRQRIF